MTYQEYKKARQMEVNDLPLFFAFDRAQFKEEMEKRGLTENDTDKIYRLSDTGGFYLRTDAEIIRAWMHRHDELPELMKDPEFAESAFYYEMGNHEYHINSQGAWDVCSCFGNCEYGYGKTFTDYLTEMGYGAETVEAFRRARERFYENCDKNGWW